MSNTSYQELTKIIQERRSIFTDSFVGKEISDDLIHKILASANYAPTHKLTQPWRFTVIRSAAKERLGEEMARIYLENTPEDKFLQKKYDSFSTKTTNSSAIIALKVQFHSDKIAEWEEIAALACAVQNMMLTAHSLEIGSYWGTPGVIKYLDNFLSLKENEKCYGLMFLGYHDEPTNIAKRSPIEEKVEWMNK